MFALLRKKAGGLPAAGAALLIPFLLAGCTGTGGVPPAQLQSLNSRLAALSEEIRRLDEEVRSLRSAQEGYDYRLSDEVLKKPLEQAIDRCSKRVDEIERRMNELEGSFSAARAEWNKKTETILDVVKKENDELRGAIEQLQKSTVSAGWEHTVSPGETLARIAKEYGARVRDIVEANEIENPNKISVGEVLFIPRPR